MTERRKSDASVLLAASRNELRFFDVKRRAVAGAAAQAWSGRSLICGSLLGAQREECERSEDQLKSKNGEKHAGWHPIESDADKPAEGEATEQNGNREQRERPHAIPKQPEQEQSCYPEKSAAQGCPYEVKMIDGGQLDRRPFHHHLRGDEMQSADDTHYGPGASESNGPQFPFDYRRHVPCSQVRRSSPALATTQV